MYFILREFQANISLNKHIMSPYSLSSGVLKVCLEILSSYNSVFNKPTGPDKPQGASRKRPFRA
jgi:hypothetical protein